MLWYIIIDEIPGYPDYQVGEEYGDLPDEVINEYPECYEVV